MSIEIQVRLKGKKCELEEFINTLKEEKNIIANQSEWKDDDGCLGRTLVFFTLIPKKVVMANE